VPWLVAAGVADGLLAVPVAPAGAVGEDFPVVAGEHVADGGAERVELPAAGLCEPGGDVLPQAEVAAFGLCLPDSTPAADAF
jgi:hypothetical protein